MDRPSQSSEVGRREEGIGAAEPILRVSQVSKWFGGIRALDQVSFDIARGRVHAVIGENGAGKSTLMKILAGVHRKDSGQVFFQGRIFDPHDRRAAQQTGILHPSADPVAPPIKRWAVLSAKRERALGEHFVGQLDIRLRSVAAKAQIHKLIRNLAAEGVAVLMISSELPEILTISDRIYVMHEGRITGHLLTRSASERTIMALATKTRL